MRNLSVNSASAEDHISSLDSPACEFKCEITNSMQLRRKAKSQIVFHNWVKHKLLFLLGCIRLQDLPMQPQVLYFGYYTINNATYTGSFFEATLSYVILSFRDANSSWFPVSIFEGSGGGGSNEVHSQWSLSNHMNPEPPGWIHLSFYSGREISRQGSWGFLT